MQIVNVDQANAWDGDEGRQWAENQERYDAASARHGSALMAAAEITDGERVLDIGCGCGATTRAAARAATSGSAVGADLSKAMLERAAQLAEDEGLHNVRFEQADAQVHPFDEGAFDLVMSKFGVMFFADPVAAFANFGRALRPEGRLTMLVWQELAKSEWVLLIRDALAAGRDLPVPPPGAPSPFSLGERQHTTAMLTEAGYRDITFDEVDEAMGFGVDADDAFDFMTRTGIAAGLLESIEDEALKTEARAKLFAMLSAHATPDGVLLRAPAWIIRARR